MDQKEFDQYCKMAFSVTLVLFGFEEGELKIFVRKLKDNPYEGAWALPGSLIKPEIGLQEASETIIEDTIGNKEVYLEQLNAFGKLYRHPYGRVIDVAFYGLINMSDDIKAYPKDTEYEWASAREMPELAYDHNEIIDFALHRLKRRLINRPIGFKLLPEKFTLKDLQQLYEAIMHTPLDKRNFRKKLKKLDILIELEEESNHLPGRNAKLYKFNPKRYHHYMEQGF